MTFTYFEESKTYWPSVAGTATTNFRDITSLGEDYWIEVTTLSDSERQYVRGISDNKHFRKCEYCGSKIMDARGNCGACGAPLP